jgi:hypothetical protein
VNNNNKKNIEINTNKFENKNNLINKTFENNDNEIIYPKERMSYIKGKY